MNCNQSLYDFIQVKRIAFIFSFVLIFILYGNTVFPSFKEIGLTAQEKKLLEDGGGKFKMSFRTDLNPVEFISKDGTFSGISSDVVKKI